ncbi:hypothetical protein BD626DRAFT_170041 [Schizophyllum amplum]|uniref:Uncharacterized protein n=1 Tax=Schizophyllum amplum TaxID=97359 RepID=A0A550CQT5_9AGAR|nr:hypothetical protein BD626DRAFT_170041 [Auriculariopsis ampla]
MKSFRTRSVNSVRDTQCFFPNCCEIMQVDLFAPRTSVALKSPLHTRRACYCSICSRPGASSLVSRTTTRWSFSPPRATRASPWLNKRPACRVVTESRSQRATCDAVPNMVLQTRLTIRPLLTVSSLNNFSRMAQRQHPQGSVNPTAGRGHGALPALTLQQIERQGWLTTAEV